MKPLSVEKTFCDRLLHFYKGTNTNLRISVCWTSGQVEDGELDDLQNRDPEEVEWESNLLLLE